MRFSRPARIALTLACWLGTALVSAAPDVAPTPATLDLGIQPAGQPVSMLSETLRRDRLLQEALSRAGWVLRLHPFAKGRDMVARWEAEDLDAGILGDMPTLDALAHHDRLALALLKHTFSTVVSDRHCELADLKGHRIGSVFGSSAHYTLLEALATAGLGERDIALLDMDIGAMPQALDEGRISAFSAWEPAPSIALQGHPERLAIYRGVSDDFLVVERALTVREPEVVNQLLAAVARAFYWMRQDSAHLLAAARWSLDASRAFAGSAPAPTLEQTAAMAQRDAVDVPSMPMLPQPGGVAMARMANKLAFLQALGKVAPDLSWERIGPRFDPQPLEEVLRQSVRYRVNEFDYAD